jgi:hypothetical protein
MGPTIEPELLTLQGGLVHGLDHIHLQGAITALGVIQEGEGRGCDEHYGENTDGYGAQ